MRQKYEVGQIVYIPKGTEINHGRVEDTDSFTLPNRARALVIDVVEGALEVLIYRYQDLVPTYWHQPEPRPQSG